MKCLRFVAYNIHYDVKGKISCSVCVVMCRTRSCVYSVIYIILHKTFKEEGEREGGARDRERGQENEQVFRD